MPLTADNSGRMQVQPSSSGMPPELTRLIAQSMSTGGSGAPAPTSKPITIRLGDDRQGEWMFDAEGDPHGRRTVSGAKKFSSIEEAVQSFYMMDDKYRANLMEKLYYYGLIDGPNNEAQAAGAWERVVGMAWNYAQAGKPVDPLDLLPRMTNLKAGQLGDSPRTTTSRSFNMLDPETAKAFIRQSFQAAMGRDPHDAEIRNLMRGLEQGFKSQPAVTQQTVDGQGNATTRVLDPGFDQQAYLANQLENDPEARAHQAAAELFPALQQALASPI